MHTCREGMGSSLFELIQEVLGCHCLKVLYRPSTSLKVARCSQQGQQRLPSNSYSLGNRLEARNF